MSKADKIIDLFNNIFLQELSHKLSKVGSSTYVHSATVSIPMFRCSIENKNTDIFARLDMTSETIFLSRLNVHCTLPYYTTHYDENRLKIAIKNALSQIYHKLLDTPLNCMLVETVSELSTSWYINHIATDANVDNHIDFKSIYGLGAVIYTPINTLKKFPGNRLKLITDISRNGGYVYISMTIKEIKQLYDNVHTSNR